MATVFSALAKATPTCKRGATPVLCCDAPRFRHYRRSTTSKAPRKRTFIANLEKRAPGDADSNNTAVVRALAPSPACGGYQCFRDMLASPAGGDGNGNGRCGGNGRGWSGDEDSFGAGSQPGSPSLLMIAAAAAAACLLASTTSSTTATGMAKLAPSLASITSTMASVTGSLAGGAAAIGGGASGSSAAVAASGSGAAAGNKRGGAAGQKKRASEAMRPRSRQLHVRLPGATMVVPVTTAAAARTAGTVHDSPLQLTETEFRILAPKQYLVRETVLV